MYIKIDTNSSIVASFLEKKESKNGIEYISAKFPRALWALFLNEKYDDIIKRIDNEDIDTLNFYKKKSFVPKYTIFKNNNKIGIAIPREPEENHRFLFIPNTYKGDKEKKDVSIHRDYYIFDIDEKYNIKDEARLIFFQ
jgi:hypothetical protein